MSKEAERYFNSGLEKAKQKNHTGAIADFDKTIELIDLIIEPNLNKNLAATYNNRGLAKYNLKQYKESIADFDKVIELNPKDTIAYAYRGDAKAELKQHKEAIADYNEAIELNPKDAIAYTCRGNVKAELKQYDEAIKDYNQAIELDPNNAPAYYNLGNIKAELKQYDKAIADFNKAIELNPKDAPAYNNRGVAKVKLKQYDEAIADYNKTIELNPKNASAYYNRGNVKAKLKQHKEAIADFDKAIELNPNLAEAHNNRGSAKVKLKQYYEAIVDYDKAIELNPKYESAYTNRGIAKAELKQYKEAITDIDKAIELNPKYADAYNNRGVAKAELKQYDKAIADYDKAIELDPKYALAYTNRGIAKAKLKQYDEAIADYNKTIELNLKDATAYYNRGNVKAKLKQYKEAIADFDEAIELNPNYAHAYNNRGIAKNDLKQHEEAIQDYNKAIELNPNYAPAYYNRGNAKFGLKQYKEAIADYDKAIELNPKYALAYYIRGLTYQELKEAEKAKKDFQTASELDPKYALAYYIRGLTYQELKEAEKAKKDFQTASELDPKFSKPSDNKDLKYIQQYINTIAPSQPQVDPILENTTSGTTSPSKIIAKIKLEELGVLRKTEFTLGDLTIICGKNNTGKTYASYSLYGFLFFWRELLKIQIPDSVIKDLQTKSVSRINIKEYLEKKDAILKEACAEYSAQISKIFAAHPSKFQKAKFSINLNKPELQVIEQTKKVGSEDIFSLSNKKNSEELVVSWLGNIQKNGFPMEAIKKDIEATLVSIIFTSAFPRAFFISTERTGAVIFRKELIYTLNQLIKKFAQGISINLDELLPHLSLNYTLPVERDIEFARELDTVTKKNSFIAASHPKIITEFEKNILGGSFIIVNDIIYFQPTGTTTKLMLNECSSSVRSLLDLSFYLKHESQKENLLIVDEPELNLHPENQRKVARLFARLINIGIQVFITTHSDYIIKELNTLIMLSKKEAYLKDIMKREGYKSTELILPEQLKVYIAEENLIKENSTEENLTRENQKSSKSITLTEAAIDQEYGIEVSSFDTTINKMNEIENAIIWGEDE